MTAARRILKPVVVFMLGCALSLGTHVATAQTINKGFYDDAGYTWWRRMSPNSREAAVKSAVLALRFGWLEGSRAALDAAEDGLKGDAATRRAVATIERVVVVEPPRFDKPPRYYADMIEKNYSANRASRKYGPLQILLCLSPSNVQHCGAILR